MNYDLCQLSLGSVTPKSYGCYDVNGYRFRSSILNLVILWQPLKIVESLLGQPTWKDTNPTITEKSKNIFKITFAGNKPLALVFFECKWYDPKYYMPKYGMT
jgi:hypothetical protein